MPMQTNTAPAITLITEDDLDGRTRSRIGLFLANIVISPYCAAWLESA
jgi:hypothetical protein